MKHLPLIILLMLVGCGKKAPSHKNASTEAISLVLVDEAAPVETTESVTEEVTEEVVTNEETVVESNNDVIPSTAKVLMCDFTQGNEKESFILNIKEDKTVALSGTNGEKAAFGGFIFSPSGNEQAAVKHTDKNFSVEEGKVIKITARILFDLKTGTGEIQLSYKVKQAKGNIDTDFKKLADIGQCSVLE